MKNYWGFIFRQTLICSFFEHRKTLFSGGRARIPLIHVHLLIQRYYTDNEIAVRKACGGKAFVEGRFAFAHSIVCPYPNFDVLAIWKCTICALFMFAFWRVSDDSDSGKPSSGTSALNMIGSFEACFRVHAQNPYTHSVSDFFLLTILYIKQSVSFSRICFFFCFCVPFLPEAVCVIYLCNILSGSYNAWGAMLSIWFRI